MASKNKKNAVTNSERDIVTTLFCIFLIIVCVVLFSTWGYDAVNYLLSKFFNVDTGSTLFDLMIGIVGIVGSGFIFTGSIFLWRMKKSSSFYILIGSTLFIIKNILVIPRDIIPLTKLSEVTSTDISAAAWNIGGDLFLIAFWIFIAIFFTRTSFRKRLSQ